MKSFEEISAFLEGMGGAVEPNSIQVEWLGNDSIAVGKDAQGRYALLLACQGLAVNELSIERVLRHGQWRTGSGKTVDANLLSLPAGESFLTAVAAIAAELLRRGAGDRPIEEVFAEVEPFVALVIRRVLLPPEYVLGLIGELLLLSELLRALLSSGRAESDPTSIWRGWMQQSRDFAIGDTSVEVKATRLEISRHAIRGLEQVEARKLDGAATERLFLASIGLRRGSAGPYSVTGLTDDILSQLASSAAPSGELNEAQQKFLDRLRQYGPQDSTGYVHQEMKDLDPYTEPYTMTFTPRFYDMGDENIRVIRSSDVTEFFPMVRPQGIAFTIELPPSVPGSIDNPRTDFREFLRAVVVSSAG